jgi:hypothetical protein
MAPPIELFGFLFSFSTFVQVFGLFFFVLTYQNIFFFFFTKKNIGHNDNAYDF